MKTLAPGYKRLQRIEESKLFSSEKTESQTWEANTLKKKLFMDSSCMTVNYRTGQDRASKNRTQQAGD